MITPPESKSTHGSQIRWRLAQKFTAVLICAIIIGLAVPAITAAYTGVFSFENLETKLKTVHPDVISSWQAFKQQQIRLKDEIKRLDTIIGSSSETSGSTISELTRQKRYYGQEVDKPAPVSLQPYFLPISYLYPIMFFCLCIVAVFGLPDENATHRNRIGMTIIISAIVYILFFAVPLLMTTVYAATSGRVVYAWSNPDISFPAFVIQNLNFVFHSLLLVVIWQQWVLFALRCQKSVQAVLAAKSEQRIIDIGLLQTASSLLLRWQLLSIIISIPFCIYSAIYWNQIMRVGDSRFLVEALIVHFLWVATVYVMALPLIVTWQGWNQYKSTMIAWFLNKEWADRAMYNDKVTVIKALSPIESWAPFSQE